MTRDDVLTLARAGFTSAQIIALAQTQPIPAPATTATAPALATSAPAPAPAYDEILRQLGVINTTLQAGAIMGAQQPAAQTADDVLASIIAPPEKTNITK